MGADRCNNTLSWDGVLCQHCRHLFDTNVVRWKHEQGSDTCRRELPEDLSFPFIAPRLWWHTVPSLRICASHSCKLCEIVLYSIGDEKLEQLESWEATIPVQIWADDGFSNRFWVLGPEQDPRPEAEACDAEPNEKYRWIMTVLKVQNISDHEPLHSHELLSLSTDSEETFAQIDAWLHACKSHKACRDNSALLGQDIRTMPTKLLELSHGDEHPSVRLIDTSRTGVGDIQYATLSHCWGGNLTAKLLKSLVDDYRLNIPWESLPLNFQHAIAVALKLSIRHIWIDALCIVQDDNEDWNHEAARMGGVYANSFLNISAHDSKDGAGGLFRMREPRGLQSFFVPHQNDTTSRCGSIFYNDRWRDSVYVGALSNRGWCVQERFLAPRLLHFTQEEVHWECLELLAAESSPTCFSITHEEPWNATNVQKSLLQRGASAEQKTYYTYQLWYQLMFAYSRGALTFTSDRPVAIAGLARIFCRLLNLADRDYLCGLWRPQLEHDLMWESGQDWITAPATLRVPGLPSWSWLSLCTDVRMNHNHLGDGQGTLEVVQAFTMPCNDPFGSVSSGEVTLRAPLCQITITETERPSRGSFKERNLFSLHVGGHLLREEMHFSFSPDDTTDTGLREISDAPVYLMLGRANALGEPMIIDESSVPTYEEAADCKHAPLKGSGYECLVLKENGPVGYFRRVGYIRFEPLHFQFISNLSVEQARMLRREAEGILHEQFVHGKIPSDICGPPNDAYMYTLTLV
ncbi:HET-domain-containing protein [Paraphaeosphaeria sporulosa]|uniref:HET-domain-containing protein n=1 Tax=Paraphaeosphaeria sporulosa TaxID=1460663 RepID=A0A177CSJ0_9PLEO|nr:HET-domain-containing protein [Paraphaeosphaeria sporulosa]OAG09850.1 HET-domain-containing protein [Paraphaeosphaeria sporulosa]